MVTLSGASLVFAVLSVCAGGFFCRCFDNYRMCILQRFPAAAAICLLPHHRNNFFFFFKSALGVCVRGSWCNAESVLIGIGSLAMGKMRYFSDSCGAGIRMWSMALSVLDRVPLYQRFETGYW